MRRTKVYSFNSVFDFGQCKGQKLIDVFNKIPAYVNWCFQKIDWFCVTDEIFSQLPITIALRKNNKLDNVKEQKDWLKILIDLHNLKKSKLNNHIEDSNNQDYYFDKNWHENAVEAMIQKL